MGWETKHKDPGLKNISSTRDQSKITKTSWLSCNYVITIPVFLCRPKEVCLIFILNIKRFIKANFISLLFCKNLLFYPKMSMKYFAVFYWTKSTMEIQ